MTKFKNKSQLPTHKEIIGSTRLFREKSMDFVCSVGAFIAKHFYSATKKEIEGASAMLKIEYTFTQRKYDTYMKNIHSALIPQLLEICTRQKEVATGEILKDRIVISEKKGIYRADNEDLIYSVDNKSKRMKLIKHLASKDNCSVSELMDITNQDKGVVIKSVQEINEKFRKKTQLTHDLILHFKASGYSLNKDDFAIAIK